MKSDSRFESLLTHIVSIEERDQVLGILVSVKGAPTNAQIQKMLGTTRDDIHRLVSDFFSHNATEKARMEFIDALEALPIIRLSVAIVPSEKALLQWHKLCREKLDSPCVLEVTKDQSVAAGAVIELKGRIFRYTLADVIEKG